MEVLTFDTVKKPHSIPLEGIKYIAIDLDHQLDFFAVQV